MAESVKNLILDHWRARHTDIVGLKEGLRDIKQRLAALEDVVAGLRRDLADQRAHGDLLSERLERLEKRLGLEK